MKFTYSAYENLIQLLIKQKYSICSYHNWKEIKKCVILRHDIDFDLHKALEMAKVEHAIGVKSTYFVLLTSDFYNVFSKSSSEVLCTILSLGHEVGLHFDEVRYLQYYGKVEELTAKIVDESRILETAIGSPVRVVSMHRPSKEMLEADLRIPDIVNSYGNTFFKDFKYLSDSRRRWREPIEEIVQSQEYDKLHILTHAFWYEQEEIDIHDSLEHFVNSANQTRYESLADNITDLRSVLQGEEVKGQK